MIVVYNCGFLYSCSICQHSSHLRSGDILRRKRFAIFQCDPSTVNCHLNICRILRIRRVRICIIRAVKLESQTIVKSLSRKFPCSRLIRIYIFSSFYIKHTKFRGHHDHAVVFRIRRYVRIIIIRIIVLIHLKAESIGQFAQPLCPGHCITGGISAICGCRIGNIGCHHTDQKH